MAPDGQAQELASVPPTVSEATANAAPPPPPAWTQTDLAYPQPPGAIQWSLAWKSALLLGIGGAALFTLSAPVIQMLAFGWILAAGFFAAHLYRRNVAHAGLTPGMGMKLGALTGVFGALPIATMAMASFAAIRSSSEMRQAMEEQMRKQMPANADPRMQEMMQNMLAWVSTPRGAATMAAFLLLVFVVLSAAGGALGASLSGRRQPH